MKALFIGGTGTISAAITRALLKDGGWELYHVNRGNRKEPGFDGVKQIVCDVGDEAKLAGLVEGMSFDVVADFIAFKPEQAERDYRIFKDKTRQYFFISSASAYQKPASNYVINESTPLSNPYWQYSRDKIACEDFLMAKHRAEGFPVTIIRPSHTYDERGIPMGVQGRGSWQVVKRIMEGKPILLPGDGTSLWTITHNSDFAKGFIGLMGNKHAIGEAVGITSDESLTWRQIHEIVADYFGKPLKAVTVSSAFLHEAANGKYDYLGGLIGDKANTVVFDNSKIKRLVPGFTCTVRGDQGLRSTLDYVMSHEECRKEDPEFDAWTDKVIAALDEALAKLKAQL